MAPTPSEAEETYAFVLRFRQARGGFSFSRLTPATLVDTANALEAIDALGKDHDHEPERAFLSRIGTSWLGSARRISAYVRALELVQMRPDETLVAQAIARLPTATIDDAAGLAGALSIAHRLGCARIEAAAHKRLSDGPIEHAIGTLRADRRNRLYTDGHRLGLDEIEGLVRASRLLGAAIDETIVRACVSESQNGDGGFGFYPGTTSFLDNTEPAARIIAAFGTGTTEVEAARTFVRACRLPSGGYARRPGALAGLEATRHALVALRLLT